MARDERQAIVLIHGIGEQRPMDTLRSFVTGIGEKDYYSKPDRLSESLELRRYTLPGTRTRPITDCYELYWAHHFDAGKMRETIRWALSVILRRPFWRVDRGLRVAIGVLQVLSAVTVFLITWFIVVKALSDGWAAVWVTSQAWLSVLVLVVNLLLGRFFTESLSDAARYLTPHPRNIAARNSIRADGLKLLRKLHDEGSYVRVVLVGHSLGSVIGLDLLRLAWDELRLPNLSSGQVTQPEAKAFPQTVSNLPEQPSRADIELFQQAQHRLWRENRKHGVRWLVTDFITIGSPLAHASLLLDTRSVSLSSRKKEGEYPTCPPSTQDLFIAERYRITDNVAGDGTVEDRVRTVLVGHHGAPFGPTKWTNLYFPVSGFSGDMVGGPVAPEFGRGIRDVPVKLSLAGWRAILWKLPLVPHVHYWTPGSESSRSAENGNITLKKLLGLDIKRAKEPYPPPSPPHPSPNFPNDARRT